MFCIFKFNIQSGCNFYNVLNDTVLGTYIFILRCILLCPIFDVCKDRFLYRIVFEVFLIFIYSIGVEFRYSFVVQRFLAEFRIFKCSAILDRGSTYGAQFLARKFEKFYEVSILCAILAPRVCDAQHVLLGGGNVMIV